MATGDMQNEPPSLGIHPRILQPATFPPFDLYVPGEDQDEFRLFRAAGEPVYLNTWPRLEKTGTEMLYVPGSQRPECLDYVEEHLWSLLDDDPLPSGQLAQWIHVLASRTMGDLMGDPDDADGHQRARRLVEALVRLMQREKNSLRRIFDCAPLNYHVHTHSVNVAALLAGFARDGLGVQDAALLVEIARGGLLHDLGKAALPAEMLGKPGPLTSEEFARVRRHPAEGLEIARPFLRRRLIAQQVIAQHHEDAGGGGYPEGRAGDAINVFARAARAADVFDALTSHRPYGNALDSHGALSTMASEMTGAFDKSVLRKFIRYIATAFGADQDATVQAAGEQPSSPAIMPGPPIAAQPPSARAEDREQHPMPDLEERLATIRELSERQDEERALMSGILDALNEALAGHVQQRARQAADRRAEPSAEGEPPAPASRADRREEVQAVRALFPLVRQVDRWRRHFAARLQSGSESAPSRDVIRCLGELREQMLEVLDEHHVELIESASAMAADVHRTASPSAGGGHVEEVGFLYRAGGRVEVLEPARVVLRPDASRDASLEALRQQDALESAEPSAKKRRPRSA
ncbi:MAG: HD domain-containing protein [Candidatus Brocadiia bacterium]